MVPSQLFYSLEIPLQWLNVSFCRKPWFVTATWLWMWLRAGVAIRSTWFLSSPSKTPRWKSSATTLDETSHAWFKFFSPSQLRHRSGNWPLSGKYFSIPFLLEQLSQTLIVGVQKKPTFYTAPWLWKANKIELSILTGPVELRPADAAWPWPGSPEGMSM